MNTAKETCAQKIVDTMNAIYRQGMTTFSGGNLSILDENGDIWITPSGVDKGNLHVDDIMRVTKEGETVGKHKPSVELAFHKQIYQECPDIRAVLHAHPPALIAESLVRTLPPVDIAPAFKGCCSKVGMAAYATPGSQELGKNISSKFAEGCDAVMLENHGIVVGAETIEAAFEKFEFLNFCAATAIQSTLLGPPTSVDETRCAAYRKMMKSPEGSKKITGCEDACRDMAEIAGRVYKKGFTPSGFLVISGRMEDGRITVSDCRKNVRHLTADDFYEVGEDAQPGTMEWIHRRIYEQHPEKSCIIMAMPPHAMAFACTGETFDSRLIPESYMVMREVTKQSFETLAEGRLGEKIEKRRDVFLIQNTMAVVCAPSLLKAYDRLEVLEFSAKAENDTRMLGDIVHLGEDEIEKLHKAFRL